ncbi:MAG: chemotaxis protein CheX [Myxococcota bacterium]
MDLTEDDIRELVREIWATVLNRNAEDLVEHPSFDGERYHCEVRIDGAWRGAVWLSAPQALALRSAAEMFSLPEEELTPDDIRDALGELANMVGGNLKSTLPEPCSLSIPSVQLAPQEIRGDEDHVVHRIAMLDGVDPLEVVITHIR